MTLTPPSDDGIEIWYTTDGDPSGEPLLLIMGLSTQHVGWDEDLVALLVGRGFHVIRFDNRDVGLSTKPDVGDLPVVERIMAAFGGAEVEAPYLLSDMAADAVAVLDALDIQSAHVMGASMGGMIAQTVAIEHPERVRSLVSVMSTTGARGVGEPDPSVMDILLEAAPTEREAAIERSVKVAHVIGSPGLVDEDAVRDKAARAFDRCSYPVGAGHQLLAIVASPDRTDALGAVSVPTLVVHGDVDPLVGVSGGEATAAAIPGAELRIVEGMAHDVPRQHWPELVDAVAAVASRAAAPAS